MGESETTFRSRQKAKLWIDKNVLIKTGVILLTLNVLVLNVMVFKSDNVHLDLLEHKIMLHLNRKFVTISAMQKLGSDFEEEVKKMEEKLKQRGNVELFAETFASNLRQEMSRIPALNAESTSTDGIPVGDSADDVEERIDRLSVETQRLTDEVRMMKSEKGEKIDQMKSEISSLKESTRRIWHEFNSANKSGVTNYNDDDDVDNEREGISYDRRDESNLTVALHNMEQKIAYINMKTALLSKGNVTCNCTGDIG